MSDYSAREFKIHIPENASRIIDVIQQAGYEAYVVGGCVRDSVMGRKPNDWDITTSALPTDVKALFKRTANPLRSPLTGSTASTGTAGIRTR